MGTAGNAISREPWNKGKVVRQKALFMVNNHRAWRRPRPDPQPQG